MICIYSYKDIFLQEIYAVSHFISHNQIDPFQYQRHHILNILCASTFHLALELHLLLQLSRIFDTKAMFEDLADILQSHPLHFWVAEINCNPAEEADCSVKSESSRWCGVLHLSQEGRCNNDVGTPA